METLQLSQVLGFQASCLAFLSEDRCAVAAGRLVLEISLQTQQQRFIQHGSAVTCLAHSFQQRLGASGQKHTTSTKWAEVLLWDSESFDVCATFSFHKNDVEAIGFIQDGEVLVTIGSDRDRTMALWPAARAGVFRMGRKDGAPLVVCSAFKGGAVSGVTGAPGSSELPLLFATYGAQHMKFWQSARSARLSAAIDGRRGAFGCDGAPKMVLCACWVARDRAVAGGSAGEIFFFHGSRAVRKMAFQPSPIACIVPLRESLAAVHANGICTILSSGQTVEQDFSTLDCWPESRFRTPLVSGASWKHDKLLLSSRTHLVCLDLVNGTKGNRSCQVLASQPSSQLTTVAAHPAENCIYTGAMDGVVRCYDGSDLKCIEGRSLRASAGVTCLAISGISAGEDSSAWMAVGCSDATISIMSEKTRHYVLRRTLSAKKAKLTCARFSSVDMSGAHPLWLAVGTEDGCIHTFRFKEATCRACAYTGVHTGEEIVSKVATLRGHEAPIFDICFADTLPCNYLLSADLSGKQLAFDVPMARRLPTLALVREVPFCPWTAPVGWQIQGCWANREQMKVSLRERRFHEIVGRQSVAVTDDCSLEIFPFPCVEQPTVVPERFEGPAATISCLLFDAASDSLIAASDTVLFIWRFSKEQMIQRMPLRPVPAPQGVPQTPDSRKSASPAFTPPPRVRSDVKEPVAYHGNAAMNRHKTAPTAEVA